MYIAILAADLLVHIVVLRKFDLQLLSQSSCCFRRTRCLDADDLDEVNDTTDILY